jgi:hypothetical protein
VTLNPLRLLCLIGIHQPSEAELKRSISDQITRCTRCRANLIKKRFGRRWRVVTPRRRRSGRGRRAGA